MCANNSLVYVRSIGYCYTRKHKIQKKIVVSIIKKSGTQVYLPVNRALKVFKPGGAYPSDISKGHYHYCCLAT